MNQPQASDSVHDVLRLFGSSAEDHDDATTDEADDASDDNTDERMQRTIL